MNPPVFLIVTDVAGTVGHYTGLSAKQILGQLSPLPAEDVRHVLRYGLQVRPNDANTIGWTCSNLLIPVGTFPNPWPATSFAPFDYTNECLDALGEIAPIVAMTNTECTAGPSRIKALRKHTGTRLRRVHTSYDLGGRKPQRWIWPTIRDDMGISAGDMSGVVTIGDRWVQDVIGPLAAGCRAVLVRTGRETTPWGSLPAGPDRLAIVGDLRDAVDVVREWAGQ